MSLNTGRILVEARNILFAMGLVGAMTALMLVLVTTTPLKHDSIVYVIPVVVAAIRWGLVAGIASAIGGVAASAFFFYPPIFSFQVSNPNQVVDLSLFIFIAVVTSELASQLSEARVRARTEILRQALIDSVSHELRTPLVSIMGAATVLHDAPALAANPQLKDLALVVREEAERLNNDIQNLLDATRIGSEGIHPRLDWADPADIVNSAVERCRARLARHRVELDVAESLPLIHVDSILVQQALVQILDNSRKYSPPDSAITISLHARGNTVDISVQDRGAGLTDNERLRLWDRFLRNERHAALASGSGLGLWIARAFVTANGGTVSASSEGAGRGSAFTMTFPQKAPPVLKAETNIEDSDG